MILLLQVETDIRLANDLIMFNGVRLSTDADGMVRESTYCTWCNPGSTQAEAIVC
jgi:hypothetical protein